MLDNLFDNFQMYVSMGEINHSFYINYEYYQAYISYRYINSGKQLNDLWIHRRTMGLGTAPENLGSRRNMRETKLGPPRG